MAGERSTKDSDGTTRLAELPDAAEPQWTPDESTVGITSSRTTLRPDPGDADVPLLEAGETLLGRLRVVRFLAQGGMGAVYEATDGVLRTRVALKLIRRRIAQDSTAMERFVREVLLARQIGHPNVCRVYELYEATTAAGDPVRFLTMELLPGETLSRKLAREGRLSMAEALPLATQMCAGLAAAHAQRVVHRDFKSSNVMLVPKPEISGESSTETTRVAITDFGLARALDGTSDGERLTGEAGILGSPEYMAPELVMGGEASPATDIYALGVVLYEMVTGKLPFAGDMPLVAAARRLREAPPRPEAPGLDGQWVETIVRCLAPDPRKRFRSALEVSDALAGQALPRRKTALGVALALSALLGAVAAVWTVPKLQSWRSRRPASVTASRPVAAILGVASKLPSKEMAWVPTAVEEMLHHELAAAETSLRMLSTDRATEARRSLGVTAEDLSDGQARNRLQALLVSNLLIYGEVAPRQPDGNLMQLRLHVLDGPTGKEHGVFSEELGPGAEKLPEAIVQIGGRLREALHALLGPQEEAVLSASRVKHLDAARAYAEGVMSMQAFDFTKARAFLDAALALDSSLVDARLRMVESWRRQGYKKNAREAAELLALQKQLLSPRKIAELTALALFLGPDMGKGIDARVAVFDARPDDGEYGFQVAYEYAPPNIELAVVKRLRQLPRPLSDDIRLDLAEAEAIAAKDLARAHGLLDNFQRRAGELGARSELATALVVRGNLLFENGQGLEAVKPLREALRLYSEVGDLGSAALASRFLGFVLYAAAPIQEGRLATDEAAAAFRRLGNRNALPNLLGQSAVLWMVEGRADMARRRLEEARSELQILGEVPPVLYFHASTQLLLGDADVAGFRTVLQEWRRTAGPSDLRPLSIEARLFFEQDRQEEALAARRQVILLIEQQGGSRGAAAARLGSCSAQCDAGHAVVGLACLEAVPSFNDPHGDHEQQRSLAEARCRYLARDFAGAEKAARNALANAEADPGDFLGRASGLIEVGRAMAANGKAPKAIVDLKAILAEIEARRGYRALAFEAALALGEAELTAGVGAGRERMGRLEQEAKQREFFRIGRLAREALNRDRRMKRVASSAARQH
jgi:eukaryotic-like serine/threonine-protein kinase